MQKKLFSKEECSFYSQEKNSTILDAADETLHRRSWHPIHLSVFNPQSSKDEGTVVDIEEVKDEDDQRVDSALDMADYSLEGFRWLDDEGDLDLELDDYHQAIAETNRRTAPALDPAKRQSRRTPSISSITIHRRRASTSSSWPQGDAPPTPTLAIKRPHSRASSFTLKHLRSQVSISSIDPAATHYQDPAARLKLRLYLASPQKFDEAVEFGFPSVQGGTPWAHMRPMTSPQHRPDANLTFFHDDTPSLSGDDDDDVEEQDTMFDPRTPEDNVFQINRPSCTGSTDGVAKPRPFLARRPTESYARGLPSDREMTLHMTLTKPELRALEEEQPQLSVEGVNKQPLEKVALPLEASPSTIWDTLQPEESKMKRFLRRLKLK